MFSRRRKEKYQKQEVGKEGVLLRIEDMRELDDGLVAQIHNILRLNPDANIIIRVDNTAYNRGYLATSQDNIDYTKLDRAQKSVAEGQGAFSGDLIDPPRGFLSKRERNDGYYLVLGDGNHRVAVGIYYGVPIDVKLVLPPTEKVRAWGFNKVQAQVKNILRSTGA